MNFLGTIPFLLALSPLIIFHELGHYWAARLCGVKVLRFSIGFGKVLWSTRRGPDQTEWAISLLPFGGYVMLLNARDPELPPLSEADRKREFTSQNVWRRIAIMAAGPAANFLLALILMTGLFMHGVAEPTARVRLSAPATPAASAGLRAGDLVTAVNGAPVAGWSDLHGGVLHALLDHQGATLAVRRADGSAASVIVPAGALATLAPDSDILGRLGIDMWRPQPVLGQVLAGGAAARAGLRPGDRILAIDGKPVPDGPALIELIRASSGKALSFSGTRAGQPFVAVVVPEPDRASRQGRIMAEVEQMPEMVTVAAGPLQAATKAASRTCETSALIVRMLGKMIVGEVSWRNVTGPLTMADYARQTSHEGPEVFLGFLAFVSISLGVMNLLPIPVLDGGLLLYYAVEVLVGRPLPERIFEHAQRAGFGLVVTLMALALFNDVMRFL